MDMIHENTPVKSCYECCVGTENQVFLKADADLEKSPQTSLERCLQAFVKKGGVLKDASREKIAINPGNAVFPICSGGWCRSQALWGMLKPYEEQIILFAPHAARYGWDPYSGGIKRKLNLHWEQLADNYPLHFGHEKSMRFGFENAQDWSAIEEQPSDESLRIISDFYDEYYFGPQSVSSGTKRLYIAFAQNIHVVMYRLNQINATLENVVLVYIDSEDVMTSPPAFLKTEPRSKEAYAYFVNMLEKMFDLSNL